jgi:hypothetical protein
VAADSRSARGYFDYTVELETPLERDCTLAQMAHVQGYGTVRRTERRLMTVSYAKASGTWQIRKVTLTAQ